MICFQRRPRRVRRSEPNNRKCQRVGVLIDLFFQKTECFHHNYFGRVAFLLFKFAGWSSTSPHEWVHIKKICDRKPVIKPKGIGAAVIVRQNWDASPSNSIQMPLAKMTRYITDFSKCLSNQFPSTSCHASTLNHSDQFLVQCLSYLRGSTFKLLHPCCQVVSIKDTNPDWLFLNPYSGQSRYLSHQPPCIFCEINLRNWIEDWDFSCG